jgi:capsular polysaccharide biosynthesis protein
MTYILTALVRQKGVIVSVFLVIAAITTAFTLLSPKKYEAHMKVLVKRERQEPVVSSDGSGAVVRAEVSEEDVNSEIDLLSNGEVLREVASAISCTTAKSRTTAAAAKASGAPSVSCESTSASAPCARRASSRWITRRRIPIARSPFSRRWLTCTWKNT